MQVTELEINDKHEPDSAGLDLWIGRTATSKCSIELSVTGILNMQSESLGVTVSEDDARELANTILNHLDRIYE